MPRLAFLAFAALLATPALPAFAQDTVRSEVVYFGDLDINTPEGADILLERLHNASRHVCRSSPGVTDLQDRRGERECVGDAEERAVADAPSSMVYARYYGVEPQVVVGENDTDYPDSVTVYKAPPYKG